MHRVYCSCAAANGTCRSLEFSIAAWVPSAGLAAPDIEQMSVCGRASASALVGEGTMKLPRRRFVQLAAASAAFPAAPYLARAQSYPTRPVHVIEGFGAGSAPDIIARLTSQWLSERLGQSFMVENRSGASGSIATEAVVRASPDGYTLILLTSANAINATVLKLNFDLIRDIAPVAIVVRVPLVMEVHPSVPAQTVPEFIAYAKANPGKINLASAGTATMTHVAAEMFKMMAGVNLFHVPYRGAQVFPAMLSGEAQVYFGPLLSSIEYVRAGQLRALAVTSSTRSHALPDVPALAETLPDYEAITWYGIGAPIKTPTAIVESLNKEINAGIMDAKFSARLANLGGTVHPDSPADFGRLISDEVKKWGKVILAANLKQG
jgi:tripartite-type tricarboxylate transporter receptor subunit TctC